METTPTNHRRRWTAEQKARIVRESYVPGRSIRTTAAANGIAPSQLCKWRHDAKFAAVIEAGKAVTASRLPAQMLMNPPARIEIVIGDAMVRFDEHADSSAIQRVIAALRG